MTECGAFVPFSFCGAVAAGVICRFVKDRFAKWVLAYRWTRCRDRFPKAWRGSGECGSCPSRSTSSLPRCPTCFKSTPGGFLYTAPGPRIPAPLLPHSRDKPPLPASHSFRTTSQAIHQNHTHCLTNGGKHRTAQTTFEFAPTALGHLKMAPSLLHPPSHLSPPQALELSQRAPGILASSPSTISSSALASVFSAPESTELWLTYENLLLSCLRTGDEKAAHECLKRLVQRFGDNNERIMAFRGLVQEAEAADNAALEKVLKEYDGILAENNTNIVSIAVWMS